MKRMDRQRAIFGSRKEHDARDNAYWAAASFEERIRTVAFLRECFYGTEATTGRLQRLYRFISRDDLMENKKSSGRTRDLADVEALE